MFTKNFKTGYHCGEKALTHDEQDRILLSCKTPFEKILIQSAISTACRRDDLVHIEWKNIDLKDRSITFFEQKKDRLHTIYFGEKFQSDLTQFKASLPKNCKYLLPKYYITKDGIKYYPDRHISSRTVYNLYNTIRRNAGFKEDSGFHSLRASAAKRAAESGWSLLEISKLLGDSPDTVQKYYLAVSPGQFQEVARNKELI
jgi:integrase